MFVKVGHDVVAEGGLFPHVLKQFRAGSSAQKGIGHEQRRIVRTVQPGLGTQADGQLCLGDIQLFRDLPYFTGMDSHLRGLQIIAVLSGQPHERLHPRLPNLINRLRAAVVQFQPALLEQSLIVTIQFGHPDRSGSLQAAQAVNSISLPPAHLLAETKSGVAFFIVALAFDLSDQIVPLAVYIVCTEPAVSGGGAQKQIPQQFCRPAGDRRIVPGVLVI